MNLNKLREVEKTLSQIRNWTVENYYSNKDTTTREICLDCLVEINHLGFLVDELIQDENIPFLAKKGTL